jgi:hypothetical protein
MRHHHQQHRATIAILGANTLAERILVQLLEGEGYSVRLLKTSSAAVVVDEQQSRDRPHWVDQKQPVQAS